MTTKTIYPFAEGDDYFTVNNGEIIESTWDFISELIHDEKPAQVYFKNYDDALASLK